MIYEGSSAWLRDILVDAWVAMQAEGLLPGGDPPIDVVQARQSKRVRAEPVAARYEVEPPRVHHVGTFPLLEDQQTTWTSESGDSQTGSTRWCTGWRTSGRRSLAAR